MAVTPKQLEQILAEHEGIPMNNLKVEWIDSGFYATQEANKNYLGGIDVDVSRGAAQTCETDLPYPAERCGYYVITCPDCGLKVAATTAGRADDPKSIKVACKKQPS